MASPPAALTEDEKAFFLEHGYVRLRGCFTREQAAEVTAGVWTRLGFSATDRGTWARERTNMPGHREFDCAALAPRAWAAICELCGGEDRVHPRSRQWRDSLIVNLGTPEGEGRDVDPQDLPEWHVDGDFFVHYLDSPEQALLVIPLFTDIVPGGGGTMREYSVLLSSRSPWAIHRPHFHLLVHITRTANLRPAPHRRLDGLKCVRRRSVRSRAGCTVRNF